MISVLFNKKTVLSAILISGMALSAASAAENKLFKIKEKPADEIAEAISEEKAEEPAPAPVKVKKAKPASEKPAAKKSIRQKVRDAVAPAKKTAPAVAVAAGKYDENGIATEKRSFSKSSGDVPVSIVRVDMNAGKAVPKIVLAKGRLGTSDPLSKICNDYGALAAINGSFFDARSYAAVGYLMIDGKSIQAPLIVKSRTTFGITGDGKVMIGKPRFRRRIRPEGEFFSMIDGINKKWTYGEIVIYTSEYGKKVDVPENGLGFRFDGAGVVTEVLKGKGNQIPVDGGLLVVSEAHTHRFKKTGVGTKINFTQNLMSPWDQVRDAFGSVMLLVTDGKVSFDAEREEVAKYLMGDAPRTALGITASNELILAVADGRGHGYRGVDFDEMAQIMVDCGCTDAVAVDGGGSSTLIYGGDVLNNPSDKGGERKITNALVILPAGKK